MNDDRYRDNKDCIRSKIQSSSLRPFQDSRVYCPVSWKPVKPVMMVDDKARYRIENRFKV